MGEKGTGDAAPMASIFAEREWRKKGKKVSVLFTN
jgi:hypothetical protein